MSSAFGPGERESASGVAARASVPRALITTTVYVIDTSVLLADPLAVTRFAEHEVVVPLVVLTELEGKRHHPELGWAARRSLRLLEDLRNRHGSLIEPMPVNDEGGTLRVELNHQDLAALPQPLSADANDHRILAVALQPRPRGPRRRRGHARTSRSGSRRASSASRPTSTATSSPPTPAGPASSSSTSGDR